MENQREKTLCDSFIHFVKEIFLGEAGEVA